MKPAHRIIEFVLEKAIEEPNHRRATLYRDLSALIVDDSTATRLRVLADEIDESERRQRKFILDFKQSGA